MKRADITAKPTRASFDARQQSQAFAGDLPQLREYDISWAGAYKLHRETTSLWRTFRRDLFAPSGWHLPVTTSPQVARVAGNALGNSEWIPEFSM